MQHADYYYVGKILRAHALSGEVAVYLDVDDLNRYLRSKYFYLEKETELQKFVVSSIKPTTGQVALVKFEVANSREDAENITGKEIYLPITALPKLTGNSFYYHEVIDFEVIDEVYGGIGRIQKVLEMPAQDLFVVLHQSTEVLIPIVDAFLVSVDRVGKKIYMTLPDGLLDVYLSNNSDEAMSESK